MKNGFGAVCDELYISTRLYLKLEMSPSRETALHFFDRIRKEFPGLSRFRRRDDGGMILEEEGANAGTKRWLRLETKSLRFGFFSPPSAEAFRKFADVILEQAPCHLTLTELDMDHLEVVYGFDMEYRGNHDQLVAETLLADHPLAGFLMGDEAVHAIDCQPYLGIALTPACDVQAYLEVKGRTSTFEVRTAEYEPQILSVYLTLRKYWGFSTSTDLHAAHVMLCERADELAAARVVPLIVNPLAQAIASRP